MADTRIWTGSDGVLDTAGNWTGATAPIADDTVVFNGTQSGSVTTNADAFTLLNFAEVIVEASYSGTLGDAGTPLEFGADKFTFRGSGKLFFNHGTHASYPTDELIIDAPSGTVQIGDNPTGAGITLLSLLACRDATLLSTLDTTTNLFIGAGVNAKLEGTNTITNVHVAPGASVTSSMLITNLHNRGSWHQTLDAQLITNMYLNGGTLKYLPTGTIALAVIQPGAVLDFTGDVRPKTVDVVRRFPGGILRRSNRSAPTITVGEWGLQDV